MVMASLNIDVDPRIELVITIKLLCDYEGLTRYDVAYSQSMRDYFSPFKTHEAVKLFKEITEHRTYSDAYLSPVLSLSKPPELTPQFPFENYEYYIRAFQDETRFRTFYELLSGFAIQSDFGTFFESQTLYYQSLIDTVAKTLNSKNLIDVLERYYGMRQQDYNLVLSPLFQHGGIGPRVRNPDNRLSIFSVIGPVGSVDGIPVFGTRDELLELIWHEFGHSFVNPVTERHRPDIGKYALLLDPILEKMAKTGGYGDWEICLNEHLIRAITSRLFHREWGPKHGDRLLVRDIEKGFRYLPALLRALEDYEQHHIQNQTFEDYYPALLKALDTYLE
ncbi:MAG: DUF4932 domain-containing protein [Gemmatimonadetes bacterium]|nr:DUF4932 domain-containing protein [Gemmatimonadota bacterium]